MLTTGASIFTVSYVFINILRGWHRSANFLIFWSKKHFIVHLKDVIPLSPDHNCLMKIQQSFVSSSTGCDVFCSGGFQYTVLHMWLLEVWMSCPRCDCLCLYPIWDSLTCFFNLLFYLSSKLGKFSFIISSTIILPHFSLFPFWVKLKICKLQLLIFSHKSLMFYFYLFLFFKLDSLIYIQNHCFFLLPSTFYC